MKQKLFIFLLLVITAVGVKAQSSLWLESGDIPGNNSIIRSGGSNIVLYGESSPTQGFLEKAEGTRCFHTGMVPLTPVSLTPTITNSKTHPICNQK